MSSPSTNPSSCDSAANYMPLPSTSAGTAEGCSATTAYGSNMKTSSPAMAQPAPGQEPHYPEGSGPKLLLTTEMANAAAEDYQREKFNSIQEWYERYQQRLAQKKEAEEKKAKEEAKEEQKPLKRKIEEDCDSPQEAKRPAICAESPSSGAPVQAVDRAPATQSDPAKSEENPLKKMEMMANLPVMQPSSRITEMMGENQSKREKAEKSSNETKEENSGTQALRPTPLAPYPGQPSYPPMSTSQPMPSPYPSPYGNPNMPPMQPGMMPPFLPGMPSYPGYRPPMQFPPGKQGAMHPFPGMPGMPPMPQHPGMRMPMNPMQMQHMQQMYMYHQQMMAKANGMSPSHMPYPAGMSPFPGMPPRMPSNPAMMNPGPMSGPTPMMNKMMPGGPMTAPMTAPPMAPMASPYPPMCSPYHNGMTSQGSPMLSRPDSTMAPNPMFGFSDSSVTVQHPSMHQQTLQDMTNKAPF